MDTDPVGVLAVQRNGAVIPLDWDHSVDSTDDFGVGRQRVQQRDDVQFERNGDGGAAKVDYHWLWVVGRGVVTQEDVAGGDIVVADAEVADGAEDVDYAMGSRFCVVASDTRAGCALGERVDELKAMERLAVDVFEKDAGKARR